MLGALLMAGGHLAMTFDASFLLALALLIAGSGCLKGNISAQVGQLYPEAAESLRTQGYTIFSAGINVGAVLGPLTCGGLAAAYGWHAGFGAAAGLMLLALIIYLAGQRHLPDERPRGATKIAYPPLTPAERKRAALLVLVSRFTLFPNVAYPMIWSIGVLWIDQHVSLASPLGAGAGVVVQFGRCLRQHRRGAAARRALGVAGEAAARAARHRPRSASARC